MSKNKTSILVDAAAAIGGVRGVSIIVSLLEAEVGPSYENGLN